jgi:hypothetical protein
MGESNFHDSRLAAYWQEVRRLEGKFNGFELHHVLRRDNDAADALAPLRLSREPPPSLRIYSSTLSGSRRTPQRARSGLPRARVAQYPYQDPTRGERPNTDIRRQRGSLGRTYYAEPRVHRGSSSYCRPT